MPVPDGTLKELNNSERLLTEEIEDIIKAHCSQHFDRGFAWQEINYSAMAKEIAARTASLVRKEVLEEIARRIKEIDEDERYHYPPAQVQINAPLALKQVAMEAKMTLLNQLKTKLEKEG